MARVSFRGLNVLVFSAIGLQVPRSSAALEGWAEDLDWMESSAQSTCTLRYLSGSTWTWRRYDDGLFTSTSTDGETWSSPTAVTGLPAAHTRTYGAYTDTGRYLNPSCVIFPNGTIYLMYEERWEYMSGSTVVYAESVFHAAKSATTASVYGVAFTPIVTAGTYSEIYTPDPSADGPLIWAPDLVFTAPNTIDMVYMAAPTGAPKVRRAQSTNRGNTWPSGSRGNVTLSGDLEPSVSYTSSTLVTHPDLIQDSSGSWHLYFTAPNDAGTNYQNLRLYVATGSSLSGTMSINEGAMLEPDSSSDCYDVPDIVTDGAGGLWMYFGWTSSSSCGGAVFDRLWATSYQIPTFSSASATTVDLSTVVNTAGTVDFGELWSIPVWDGSELIVSTEYDHEIRFAAFDEDLVYQTDSMATVLDAGDVSTAAHCQDDDGDLNSAEGEGEIADHKHLYLSGYHYVTFSNSGNGDGGCLRLAQLDDATWAVTDTADVTDTNDPTNDMLMVTDGTEVYVGKWDINSPSMGLNYGEHLIYAYDPAVASTVTHVGTIGGDSATEHANGAGAAYNDGAFSVLSPQTLAPGNSYALYAHQYDDAWSPTIDRKTAYSNSYGTISISSALTWDPTARVFIGHFGDDPTGSGDSAIYRVLFDRNMRLVDGPTLVVSTSGVDYARPHTELVGDRLYLGYDADGSGFTPYVTWFDLTH